MTEVANGEHHCELSGARTAFAAGDAVYAMNGAYNAAKLPGVGHGADYEFCQITKYDKKTGKPLMFLVIGWFTQQNAAFEPWDYTKPVGEEPIDLQLQKRLYEGFFESWWGNSALGGFSIWEWPPNSGGPDDRGYTPEGKPALDVLKAWLKKGRWEVKSN